MEFQFPERAKKGRQQHYCIKLFIGNNLFYWVHEKHVVGSNQLEVLICDTIHKLNTDTKLVYLDFI